MFAHHIDFYFEICRRGTGSALEVHMQNSSQEILTLKLLVELHD